MLRKMQEDNDHFDDKYWEEYERFNKEKNTKFKDLNRRNIRSIELIKDDWDRTRLNHMELAKSNPFDNSQN